MSRSLAIASVALIAWGVLAFGAVYPWAYWPLFAGCALAGGIAVVSRRAWQDARLRAIGAAWLLVALAIAIQTVRLPAWIVTAVSPGVDAYFRAFRIGYHPADLQTLSLAPAATLASLSELFAIGLLVLGLARVLRPSSLEWLGGQVVGLGVGLAAFGIVQRALMNFQDPAIYGFWHPQPGATPFGPFVNRNHFAGWMVMALPVVIAYGWGLVQRAERNGELGSGLGRWLGGVNGNRVLLVAVGALMMAVATFMTGSRSGFVSLLVALGTLSAFVVGDNRGRRRWRGLVAVAAVVGGGLFWAGTDLATSRFARSTVEFEGRRQAWNDTVRIIRDFPVFGVGLGAYKDAMLVYQSGERRALYAEAHNDYLQLVAEGGAVTASAAVLLIGTIGWGIRRRMGRPEDDLVAWVRRGAVAGLAGILAQSVVEFSLQMPGNAVLCGVLCSMALHRPYVTSDAHRL